MPLHACALLRVMAATGPESDLLTSERTAGTAMPGSGSNPSVARPMSGSVRSDCSSEEPVASGWLAGVARWILVRWREERWFFTSLFLIRLTATPLVLVADLNGARPKRLPKA